MQVVKFIRSTWRLLGAGLFSIATLTPKITPAVPTATVEPPSAWSQPVSMAYGWFPDIAADSYGGLHVVWSTGKSLGNASINTTQTPEEFDVVMYTSNPDGTKWSAPNDIAAMTSGGEVTRPSLLIDQNGILHLTYREIGIFYSQAPVDTSISARTWQPPLIISENQVAYFSRMAEDFKRSNTPGIYRKCPLASLPDLLPSLLQAVIEWREDLVDTDRYLKG